jgi:GntR family transcriptional regulator / MocR family aminotransferase
MIDLSKFVSIDSTSRIPIYIQIAEQISKLIEDGVLPQGIRIQPTRELALLLSINRNTIVASYNELLTQKWVEVKDRKGYFVSKKLPLTTPLGLNDSQGKSTSFAATTSFEIGHELLPEFIRQTPDPTIQYIFNEGFPDVRLAPLKALVKEYYSMSNRKSFLKYLNYSEKEGSLPLRLQLVKMLRETRGMSIGAENILITKGGQMGIFLASSLLVKPGELVVVGDPNYFIVNGMFRRMGVDLVSVPVDEEGMNVDILENICSKSKIRLVYVIPHHHHPTTVTLSSARRLKLLELANTYKFAIIEDDFDFDLHYENRPTLPMASFDKFGSVIYIGTFSKIIAPSIRLGYVVAPQNFISILAQHKFMIELQGDNLLEEAMCELLKNGTVERHLKKIKSIYKERRDFFCKLLSEKLPTTASFDVPKGGMSVWVTFKDIDVNLISLEARKRGLLINPGKRYSLTEKDHNGMSIGFASMNLQELDKAGNILVEVVKAMKPDV